MNTRVAWKAMALAMLMLAVAVASTSSADADENDGMESIYCYGDFPYISYVHPEQATSVDISWDVKDQSGNDVKYQPVDGSTIQVDLTGVNDRVTVIQTVTHKVTGETATETKQLIPVHMDSGDTYEVRFTDGINLYNTYVIGDDYTVREGDIHVLTPSDPEKDGYEFRGWFLDRECTVPFDPYKPVTGDTDVYAGWRADGSSSGGTITTIVRTVNHIVTFKVPVGLEVNVIVNAEDRLLFSVDEVLGLGVDIDTVMVSVDGSDLAADSAGLYSLTVDRDITVTISVSYIGGGEPAGDGFPWWIIVLVVIIILVILALLIAKRRKDRNGIEPQ